MKNLNCFCILIVLLAATTDVSRAAEPIFIPVKIDGPVHDPANHSYWFGPFCECCSVLDVDGDGDLDIAAGRKWYETPDWIKYANFRDGAEINGPETDDNSEFAMDVNFDGRMDIVSSGWMFMKGAFWYENPGNKDAVWKSTRIHMALNMEGVIHGDIDGDGDEDILCNHWSLVKGQGMTWLEHIDREPWFVEHVVGTQGDVHGNGLGDINGDGRIDIVTPVGWYEQPKRATDTPWKFHADYRFEPAKGRGGGASHPILVHDVDEDGLNDIIIGSSHAYGLAWLEQIVDRSGKRTFNTHWADTEFSQFHTMALGDLNGDGKVDLVTGKRLFAHHGDDIGAFEPLYAFWYDIKGGEFERHVLSFNHLPHYPDEEGINPPPNYVVSVGMKLNIADMNNDGRNDVVIAGKGGLYVFFNHGFPTTPPRAHKLPPRETYPTWRSWPGYGILFNGKDLTGWKVPEGDNGHWKVIDGVIDYDAMSEAEGNKSLWTEESFGNYALHIEWRFKRTSGLYPMPTILPDGSYKTDADGNVIKTPTPNADSGILLRGRSGGQANLWCWPVGSGELWSVRNNKKLAPELRAAAVPKVRADNPVGQWNSMDITLIGNRVTIMLNGKIVIKNAQIPGIAEEGSIGLQHHGGIDKRTGKYGPASSLIQFRNIWIKSLDNNTKRLFKLVPDAYGMALKTPDGRTVFRYMTKKLAVTKLTANSVCCLYPVNTPSGEGIVDFAPSDHPHHRGAFLAWHSIKSKQKADFWGWGEWAPTKGRVIKNRSVKLIETNSTHVTLEIHNDWTVEGENMINETLSALAREEDNAYVIDLHYQLTPTVDVTLDKTAFGDFCVKARKDGKLVYTDPKGEVKLPNPNHLKPETDWPATDWYDYTIKPNNGKTVGIAVLDHPSNPATTWHNLRTISMVNPCIVAPGAVTLKKGQPFGLRYRLVTHDGPAPVGLPKKLSSQWRDS